MAWIYRFTGNPRYPEPNGEILALVDIWNQGQMPYLLLADRTHPPLAGQAVQQGALVYLCTATNHLLEVHAQAHLAELHQGAPPPSVAGIYQAHTNENRYYRGIVDLQNYPDGPHGAAAIGLHAGDEGTFLDGQAYVMEF